jgi:hypothetical protein
MKASELINELIRQENPNCVSIFLPTHIKGEDVQQDIIRLKNLIRQASNELYENGLRDEVIEDMLFDTKALLNDTEFWQYQNEGLALFIHPGYFRIQKTPFRMKEHIYIGDHFNITPVLPLLSREGSFFILALSQKDVRLYNADLDAIERFHTDAFPNSLKEFLKYDDLERQLQMRSSTGDTIMFHGHGGGSDDAKKNIVRFIKAVESGVTVLLNNSQDPLILAGVESITSAYRVQNRYKYILEKEIRGNPDIIKDSLLHQKALKIAGEYYLSDVYDDIKRFEELAGTDRCSTDIRDIVIASEYGKIETLLLADGTNKWGKFDKEKQEVLVSNKPVKEFYDLVNYSAVKTLKNGGSTHSVNAREMPGKASMAAIFRY